MKKEFSQKRKEVDHKSKIIYLKDKIQANYYRGLPEKTLSIGNFNCSFYNKYF